MKGLAFSTNAFKKNTFEEAIDAIADIGYRGIELMADMHHAYPPAMTPSRTREIKSRIESRGMTVSNINGFTLFELGDTYHPTWIEDDDSRRNERIHHTRGCIELAQAMGCKTISLQPGGPMIGTTISRKLAAQRFADGLSQLLPMAQQAGVILAIEPEPGLFIQTAAEYLEFVQEYFPNSPNIRMNCDVGHLFCVGEDPASVIRSMPAHVAHVHLEDIGENRVHQHLTPGKGAIDFPAIFAALQDIGYSGWDTIELYPYETSAAGVAKQAWKYLKPMTEAERPARECPIPKSE